MTPHPIRDGALTVAATVVWGVGHTIYLAGRALHRLADAIRRCGDAFPQA